MRRLALSLIPLMLLACKEEPPDAGQAAVRLEVLFPGFNAGCITVRAQDKAATEHSSMTRIPVLGRAERKVTVAVFRQEGWGDTLEILTSAHEPRASDKDSDKDQECEGFEVTSGEVVRVTLDKPGVVERRVTLTSTVTDTDGDGYIQAGNGGTDCNDAEARSFPGNPEVCDGVDNDCDPGLTVDEGFDKAWYRDMDGDGSLDEKNGAFQCDPPGSDYVHANSQPFDCDDRDAERTPGKQDVCDGKDNDCDGPIDEDFPSKGLACTNDICSGVIVCNAQKTGTVCGAPAPVTYHPDVDGDGEGARGSAGTKVCPPVVPAGTAANATDCDDVDRSARAGLVEVCDAVDNDCDGQVDEELSCGGTLKRVVDTALGGNSHDWRAVAVGPGGLPVWIAGIGGKLVVRKTAGGAFQSHSFGDSPANTTNCGDTDWYTAWVRPSDGNVFLAGQGGRVAQHTGTACINQATASNTNIMTGIVGFESGGATTLYIVNTDGRLFTWVPGSAPVDRQNTSNVYNGIHALDPNLLLVATEYSTGRQVITSYVNGDLSGHTAHTMDTSVTGNLNSVWMATSSLAYGVGDDGSVWKWDGATNWALQARPPSGTADLYGVVTLPNGDAYTVDSSGAGQLHRRTPYGWAVAPKLPTPTKPLFGIAMSSERDYWVVGNDGYVFHYPEP